MHISGVSLSAAGESGPEGTPRAVRLAATEIQQLVLSRLSRAVARRLVGSMDCLQDSVVGTLMRTLCSLERTDRAELGDIADIAEPELFVSHDSKETAESWDLSSCTESQGMVVSGTQGPQLASDALKQVGLIIIPCSNLIFIVYMYFGHFSVSPSSTVLDSECCLLSSVVHLNIIIITSRFFGTIKATSS